MGGLEWKFFAVSLSSRDWPVGRAFILEPDDVPVSRHRVAVEGISREIGLLDGCLVRLAGEIGEDERAARDRFGKEISMIFEAQHSMLLDKS